MTFQIDLTTEVDNIVAQLTKSEREQLLRHFVAQEATKKVREINKNYKDVGKVAPESFASRVAERLTKKIAEPVTTDVDQPAVAAAKTKKASKKA